MSLAPFLLIGTYTTNRAAIGAYLCRLGDEGVVRVRSACALPDPSFLVRHPGLPLAYAVNEAPAGHGSVSVLAVDTHAERLELLQQVDSHGEAPCHVAISADGGGLFVTHFTCGTVRWYGLGADGRITQDSHVTRHRGSSIHPRRQASAHPHCTVLHGGFAYVTDLGLDCVVRYVVDERSGFQEVGRTTLHAGAGPRHLCFAGSGAHAYVCNEIDNTVSTLAVQASGELTEQSWCSTLPAGISQRSATGEVALHPNGRWLYVSNRGFDSIAWFALDAQGALRLQGVVPAQGVHPRHFLVTPDGQRLIVANRDSDNIVHFRIDPATGGPVAPGVVSSEVPAPVCVCWW